MKKNIGMDVHHKSVRLYNVCNGGLSRWRCANRVFVEGLLNFLESPGRLGTQTWLLLLERIGAVELAELRAVDVGRPLAAKFHASGEGHPCVSL